MTERNRTYVLEQASKLAEKRADGSYRVVLITEGTGSTGVYSADLIDNSVHVFENAPSYMDHPIDPERPQDRSVLSIGGRFKNVEAEDGPEGRQLAADFYPRAEYRPLVEEFGDILGLSIYCGAYGEKDSTGRVAVEAFDDEDPYRSVDMVVAAGRGGRFKRATESLRSIESSLGTPKGAQPGAASAQDHTHTQEESMELKDVEALLEQKLAEHLKTIVEFFANEDARRQAEADAAGTKPDVSEAVEAFDKAREAIADAKLTPTLEKKLIAKAKNGEDVADDLAEAKTTIAEAVAAASGAKPGTTFVHEGAGKTDDFTMPRKGGRR